MGHCIITVLLAVSVGLTVAVPSRASVLQEKLNTVKHTLEQVRRDIEKTRQRFDQLLKKHGAVRQNVDALELRLRKERDEVEAIRWDIKQRERTMNALRDEITTLQSQINNRKAMLVARVRRLYMEGRTSWFHPLLSAGSYTQFQHRVMYLSTLNAWEDQELEQHRRDLERLEQRRREHEAKVRAAQSTERSQIQKIRTMEDAASRKKVVLASLARQMQSEKEREETLETLINKLYQQRHMPAAAVTKRTAGSFRKGELLWPVEGEPVGAFGRQKHPAFDTYVDKKGIEIQTKEGEDIRAVSGGTVVYADWLKGYGLVVILDHGTNYLTFYAHASSLRVKERQTVARGAVLGKTGASGLTDRVVLYFELREGIKPVNPLGWFAKR